MEKDASSQSELLQDIHNYLAINEMLSTSGQPTEIQFGAIKKAGFTVVINLAPHTAENAIENESGILRQLGLKYIHLPVDFAHPTEKNFSDFVRIMQAQQQEKVWLHCAANKRVSAFLHRYRCSVLAEDPKVVRADLEKIWQPDGVWRSMAFRNAETTTSGRPE